MTPTMKHSALLLVAIVSLASGAAVQRRTTASTTPVTNPFTPTTTTTRAPDAAPATAPIITCPGNVIAIARLDRTRTVVRFPNPTVQDTPASFISLSSTFQSGATFRLGTTRVTFFATDMMTGLTSECSFLVIVRDVETPGLVCPQFQGSSTLIVETDPGMPTSTQAFWPTPVATDNDLVSEVRGNVRPGTPLPIGTTTVTFSATDRNGNAVNCSFNVVVQDRERPRLTCPATEIIGNTTTDSGRAFWPLIASSDNSGRFVAINASAAPGVTLFPLGVTVVNVTGTDAFGNSAGCTFRVRIVDVGAPAITCPADITVSTDAGKPTGTASWPTTALVSDNSGVLGLTVTCTYQNGFNGFAIGNTAVHCTVQDQAANQNSCQFVVTVIDTQAPLITCPFEFLDIQTDPWRSSGRAVWPLPIATDNSRGPVVIQQIAGAPMNSQFSISNSPITITYQATDAAGNSATCSFAIRVIDNEAPILTCSAADITVNADATGTATVDTAARLALVTVIDNVDGNAIALVQKFPDPSISKFPIGTTQVTVEGSDAAGNVGTCTYKINVLDITPPVPANPDCLTGIAINANTDPGRSLATVTWPRPIFQDNSGGLVTLVSSRQEGDNSFIIGATQVTFLATDASGNSEICLFVVTVSDIESPRLTCPADIVATTDPASAAGTASWPLPKVSDNSAGTITLSQSHVPGVLGGFPLGVTEVTISAVDPFGNVNSCKFLITIVDDEIPLITCPANIFTDTDRGADGGSATFQLPTVRDNTEGVVSVKCDHNSGTSSFPIGVTTITCEAKDAAGNINYCSFIVQVFDVEPPTIFCPADVTVHTERGKNFGIATWDTPRTLDNSKGVVQITTTIQSGSQFPLGSTSVRFDAEDPSRNPQSCTFTVTVLDKEIPAIICPADITTVADLGASSTLVSWPAPFTSDNSGFNVSIESVHVVDPKTGKVSPILDNNSNRFSLGTTTVRLTAVDEFGNTNVCTFTITVLDIESPRITCPADVTVNTLTGLAVGKADWVAPAVATSVSDNSNQFVSIVGSARTGQTFPLGTTTVTYIATDTSGNQVLCSFVITVIDNEAPRITCPANVHAVTDSGVATGRASWQLPLTADNSLLPVSLTTTTPEDFNFPLGSSVVEYIATDRAGQQSKCSFAVTIRDNEAPRLICPASQVVFTDVDKTWGTAVWADSSIVRTDNVDSPNVIVLQTNRLSGDNSFPLGLTVVRYTATDSAGNVNTCSFTITVLDSQAPGLIICPNNIVVGNDPGRDTAVVSWSDPKTYDNTKRRVTLSSTHRSGDRFPMDDIVVVTYTAVDGSGNTATCSFAVFVADVERPALTCPTNILATTDAGKNFGTVFWRAPTPTDNSGQAPLVTSTRTPGQTFALGNTTVTYFATDASGNQNSCSFNITIVDAERPLITCPANIVTNNAPRQGFASVSYPAATVSDNSGGPIKVEYSAASGANFPVGTTEVTVIATDATKFTSQCRFTITVRDAEAPRITCPATVNAFKALGADKTVGRADWTVPRAVDNNGDVGLVVVGTSKPGDRFPVGETVVTYRARDAAGNEASCTFKVVITIQTIKFIGQVVDSKTSAGLSKVRVVVSDYLAPRPIATIPPTTTTTTTTTTRARTTKATRRPKARRNVGGVAPASLSVVTDNVGNFELLISADPRNITFLVDLGNGASGRVHVNIYEGFPSTASVSIGVARVVDRNEWQLVTSWLGTAAPQLNNFNAMLQTPFGCRVDYANKGCVDSSTFRYAQLNADYKVIDSSSPGTGPETVYVSGTARGIYNHFIYGFDLGSSFRNSQLQVAVYNINGYVTTVHVKFDGAADLVGPSQDIWRFWHTLQLDLDRQQVVLVNRVTCDPRLSTGAIRSLPTENGARNC
jgi:hypothetical protein